MASHCRKLVSACNVSKYRHYKPAFTEYADKFELLALQMFECCNSASEAEIVLREHTACGLLDHGDIYQYALFNKMMRLVARPAAIPSRSVPRALLTPQVHPGSLYRRGKSA